MRDHGCIRMYPEDIERLFTEVAVGTPVNIVNQPVKLGLAARHPVHRGAPPLEEDPMSEDGLRALALALVEEADRTPGQLLGRDLPRGPAGNERASR
jgi:L,D-transpeptidase ErfK/SrfK